MTRAAARDLYDVHNMIKNNLIKDEHKVHLRKSIIFYFVITSNNVDKGFNLEMIDRINERMIKRDLKPVLSNYDPFNLKEAKEVVKNYLFNLMNFTDDEKKFIGYFIQNQYEPAVLFDNEQVLERIKDHPMALWRTK